MAQKFAVFDIDGTLYRGTFFVECVEAFIAKEVITTADVQKLALLKKAWKDRDDPESYRYFVNYLVEVWDASIKDISLDIFEATAAQFAEAAKGRAYRYTRDLIKQLKAEGYILVAISGSFHEAVEPFAKYYGFDIIYGEQNIRDGAHLTGELHQITYHDKHLVLEKIIKEHDLTHEGSYGVGDTSGDTTMLAAVERPVAFNPDKNLHNDAIKNGWKIVVERKNVIYELEPNGHGAYLLAQTSR